MFSPFPLGGDHTLLSLTFRSPPRMSFFALPSFASRGAPFAPPRVPPFTPGVLGPALGASFLPTAVSLPAGIFALPTRLTALSTTKPLPLLSSSYGALELRPSHRLGSAMLGTAPPPSGPSAPLDSSLFVLSSRFGGGAAAGYTTASILLGKRGREEGVFNPPPPPLRVPKADKVVPLPPSLLAHPDFSVTTSGAARLILTASDQVRLTRDPALALLRTGASAAFSALSGGEKLVALTEARVVAAVGSDKNTWRRENYLRWMAVNFPFMRALPATVESVIVYGADYVIGRGNMAKYLPDVVSSLRVGLAALEEWALTPEDEALLRDSNAFLRRRFPSVSVPPPTLSLQQLEVVYEYLVSVDTLESRLCLALLKLMVGMQARATELCDGALWVKDLVFDIYGVLIKAILSKTRKYTLAPLARVAPRLPEHVAVHDPYAALHDHLYRDAGWGSDSPPPEESPLFRTPILLPSGQWILGATPLSSAAARTMIIKYIGLAGVSAPGTILDFNMHFGRGCGFNLLHNALMLDKPLCAAAGGWRAGDILDDHYHRRSPVELAVRIRYEFIQRCALMGWRLP